MDFLRSIYENIFGLRTSKPLKMSQKKDYIKDLILKDKVVIFSKSYCPYCKMAKDVFDQINEKYVVVELDEREDGDELQGVLGEMTGARTVPRVFVKGNCLGGGSDVKALLSSGELQKIVS